MTIFESEIFEPVPMPQSPPIPATAPYEDSYDYRERMASVLFDLLRSGLDLDAATYHMRCAQIKAFSAKYPKDPATVSAREYACDIMRICETHLVHAYKFDPTYKNFMIGLEDDLPTAYVSGVVADPSRMYKKQYDERKGNDEYAVHEKEKRRQKQREELETAKRGEPVNAEQYLVKRRFHLTENTTTVQQNSKKAKTPSKFPQNGKY